MTTSTPFRVLLHAANLRHRTDGFTSPPKKGVLRIFSSLKIRRLRPGLNPRTWVLKASTLPPDHFRDNFISNYKTLFATEATIYSYIHNYSSWFVFDMHNLTPVTFHKYRYNIFTRGGGGGGTVAFVMKNSIRFSIIQSIIYQLIQYSPLFILWEITCSPIKHYSYSSLCLAFRGHCSVRADIYPKQKILYECLWCWMTLLFFFTHTHTDLTNHRVTAAL